MEFDNPQARSYLAELFKVTGTNLDSEASMYDVGAALRLENDLILGEDARAVLESVIEEMISK